MLLTSILFVPLARPVSQLWRSPYHAAQPCQGRFASPLTGFRLHGLRQLRQSLGKKSAVFLLLRFCSQRQVLPSFVVLTISTNYFTVSFLDLARYDEALAYSEYAIKLNPKADFFDLEATALFQLKRYEEALAVSELAIQLDPNHAVAYNNRGEVLRGLKRYDEAIQAYEHASEIDPDLAAYASYGKGQAFADLERYEEALGLYVKAIQLEPKEADFYQSMADALKHLGRIEEAQRAYAVAEQLK